jgi:hypothetical protein
MVNVEENLLWFSVGRDGKLYDIISPQNSICCGVGSYYMDG